MSFCGGFYQKEAFRNDGKNAVTCSLYKYIENHTIKGYGYLENVTWQYFLNPDKKQQLSDSYRFRFFEQHYCFGDSGLS